MKKKRNIIILFFIGIIIVFFVLFRVVIYRETYTPGTDCKVVVGRFVHGYIGVVTDNCNYADCENKTKFVSGRLNTSNYQDLKKELANSDRTMGYGRVCQLFK